MDEIKNIDSVREVTGKRLDETLAAVRALPEGEAVARYAPIAEYLILEAKEYVNGAWEMLASGKASASIALSRWVLEAAINLCWAVADGTKKDERIKALCGEALFHEANLCDNLAEIWPHKATDLKKMAQVAKDQRDKLGIKDRLVSLPRQLQEAKKAGLDFKQAYPRYKVCCAKAHPGLRVWERSANMGSVVSPQKSLLNERATAQRIAAASAFQLIGCCYYLTGTGDADSLNFWWEKQVRPLLEVT